MDAFFRVVFYFAIGLVLLGANFWYIRSVRSALMGDDIVIAPFEITGQQDDNGKLGAVLAQMLQVKLRQIQQDLEASQRNLIEESRLPSQEESVPASGPTPYYPGILPPQSLSAVSIPTELLTPVTINAQVSGVEVGGILSSAQRWMVKNRTLNFSVHYEGKEAIIVGNPAVLGISTGNVLWLKTKATPDEIATSLAYALIKMKLSETQSSASELDALTTDEFQSLLLILKNAAELNRRVKLGRVPTDGFPKLFAEVEPLTAKMPKWQALILLTANIAESAQRYDRAIFYYQQFKQFADADGNDTAWVDARIKELPAGTDVEYPATQEGAVAKIREDATYAVDFLNELTGLNLDVPPIELLDESVTNAYWSGEAYSAPPQIQYLPDVTYNQIAVPYIDSIGKLVYRGQSGAIATSYADVFGSLIKQARLEQTAKTADWLVGPGAIAWLRGEDVVSSDNKSALRSLKAPGTAYDDPIVGKDPQVAHMRDYVETTTDNGGVHLNSGIPNKAFYETAIQIGSEKAGRIWFITLRDKLTSQANFQDLATLTFEAAGELYGEGTEEQKAVKAAWETVGILVKDRN